MLKSSTSNNSNNSHSPVLPGNRCANVNISSNNSSNMNNNININNNNNNQNFNINNCNFNNASTSNSINNPITRLFSIKKQTGSCGVELPWRIYEAVRIVDGMACSVFVFEKKIAEKLHKPRRKEIICEFLRREVQNCASLNHLKILKIIHMVEENNETLAFATERVFASLSNVLGNESRLTPAASNEVKKVKLTDLEIKHGIYQLTDCLRYLHTSKQLVHNNINPFVILITKIGQWKIFGTGFLSSSLNIPREQLVELQWSSKTPKMVQPDLDYIAPETQCGGNINSAVDMFALGLVICTIYNNGKGLINANKILTNYLKCIDDLHKEFSHVTSSLPPPLVEPVEKMLNKDIRYRPSSQLFSLLKYFDDMLLHSIDGLINFDHKNNDEKIQYLQGLPDILPEYPKDLLISRVYNFLMRNILESRQFYEPCFQSLMSCVESCSIDQFNEHFRDGILDIISRARSNSIQECTSIIQFSEPLFFKMTPVDIQNELVPILLQLLESDIVESQTAAFDSIKYFRDYLDERTLREHSIPKLISTFTRRKVAKVRISALIAVSVLVPVLSKSIITEDILPFLTEISTNDVDLVMSIVGIYKEILNRRLIISKELIVKIAKSLLDLVLNPSFKRHHTRALIDILHLILEKIDLESTDSFESNSEFMLDTEISSIEACDNNLETVDSEPEIESEIERIHSSFTSKKVETKTNQSNIRPSFSIGSPATRKISAPALKLGKNMSSGNLKFNEKVSHKTKLLQISSFKFDENETKPGLSFPDRRRQTIDASMGTTSNYRTLSILSQAPISPGIMSASTNTSMINTQCCTTTTTTTSAAGGNTIRLTGGKNIKTTPRNIVLSAIAQSQVSDEEKSLLKQQMTPPPIGRRHSFAFSTLPADSSVDLITASVCEGPFTKTNSSTNPNSAGLPLASNPSNNTTLENTISARQRWQQNRVAFGLIGNSTAANSNCYSQEYAANYNRGSRIRRHNSSCSEKPPVTRQSSFTVLSDAVMNFFSQNNPQTK